jgi:hypothetical protein
MPVRDISWLKRSDKNALFSEKKQWSWRFPTIYDALINLFGGQVQHRWNA